MAAMQPTSNFKQRLLACPPVGPLALTTINLGTAWVVAASVAPFIGLDSQTSASASKHLLNVRGSVAVIMLFAFALRTAMRPYVATAKELYADNGPYAAALMAAWSCAAWFYARGGRIFSIGLWSLVLVLFLASQLFFIGGH